MHGMARRRISVQNHLGAFRPAVMEVGGQAFWNGSVLSIKLNSMDDAVLAEAEGVLFHKGGCFLTPPPPRPHDTRTATNQYAAGTRP